MNFLLAPNAMKGALSASQISVILQRTLRRKYPRSSIIASPIADGGNGTLDCLMNALGGTVYEKKVTGPIPFMNISARFGITNNHIGIIESAEAVGLHHITPTPKTIARSTSRGVGELVLELINRQCREIRIGLGGSATNDAGAGMARALGYDFFDQKGESIPDGVIPLLKAHRIKNTTMDLTSTKIIALSDVTNQLIGENGATYTFARQKGADEEQLPYLEAAINNFADVVEADRKKRFREIPGSGAAGGLGFGLLSFCNAEIHSGIETILDAIDFNSKIEICDHVITAEGMLDEQSLHGKGIAGIVKRAQHFKKPVHAFVGKINGDPVLLQRELGLASLVQISPGNVPRIQAMRDASWLLADAVYHHTFSSSAL